MSEEEKEFAKGITQEFLDGVWVSSFNSWTEQIGKFKTRIEVAEKKLKKGIGILTEIEREKIEKDLKKLKKDLASAKGCIKTLEEKYLKKKEEQ